jgi:hypothetical protein
MLRRKSNVRRDNQPARRKRELAQRSLIALGADHKAASVEKDERGPGSRSRPIDARADPRCARDGNVINPVQVRGRTLQIQNGQIVGAHDRRRQLVDRNRLHLPGEQTLKLRIESHHDHDPCDTRAVCGILQSGIGRDP